MLDLPKIPLSQGSSIEVYQPDIEFFIEKLQKREYFAFTRQLHGLWDSVIGAWILDESLRNIQLDNENYLWKLAQTMSKGKEAIEGLYYPPKLYLELLQILKNLEKTPENFFFGIGDTYFYPEQTPPYHYEHYTLPRKCPFKYLPTSNKLKFYKLRFGDRQEVMQYILPKNKTFFDGLIWKRYTYYNQIQAFFEVLQAFQVIGIAPKHYHNFGELVKLPDYTHVAIHHNKASESRKELLEHIMVLHNQKKKFGKPCLYFFVAGSLSVWLVYHLQQQISDAFFVDIGQAFNYLYDSKEGLLHREFGLSHQNDQKRKSVDAKKWYGTKDLGCKMQIIDNQVIFSFKDHFWMNLPEKILLLTQERNIRRKWIDFKYQLKHQFVKSNFDKKNT